MDPDNQWRYGVITSQGLQVDMPIPHVDPSYLQTLAPDIDSIDEATVRSRYAETLLKMHGMRGAFINDMNDYYQHLKEEHRKSAELERRAEELGQQVVQMTLKESRRVRKSRRHDNEASGS
jgi:hypothetical protein